MPVTPHDDVDSQVQTNEVVVDACAVHTLPAGADFIMCYSVAEGESSDVFGWFELETRSISPGGGGHVLGLMRPRSTY